MYNKLKILAIGILTLLYLSPVATVAAINCANPATAEDAIQCGADTTAGVPQNTSASGKINSTVSNLIDILSIAVGILAVIMLIVGGFRYITSGGNPEATKAAKNTIMYALVGLTIVALAQIIVNFVLNKATG